MSELDNKIAAATFIEDCCSEEHDPAQCKLHGYCVLCGVPWPCDTAKQFLAPPKEPEQ